VPPKNKYLVEAVSQLVPLSTVLLIQLSSFHL